MSVTFVYGPAQYYLDTQPENTVVLSVMAYRWEAHWDSGQPDTDGWKVWLWDGIRATVVDCFDEVAPTVTASTEDIRNHAVVSALSTFLHNVRKSAESALYVNVGSQVEVYKGRKTPKGRYEVVKHALGDYGPYVNLRDPSGKYYSFVSMNNVRVIPNYIPTLSTKLDSRLVPFIVSWLVSGCDMTSIAAMIDLAAEESIEILPNVTNDELLEAHNRLMKSGESFKMYTLNAERANYFTKTRY